MSASSWRVSIVAITATLLLLSFGYSHDEMFGCSEGVCARVVTKCLLTEHCRCNLTSSNFTCHRECFGCLADLCYECCACFGMCPKTVSDNPDRVSNIEEVDEPIPQLFKIYTEDGDDQIPPRYTTHTVVQQKRLSLTDGSIHELKRNCTVAYATKCMSDKECKITCESMGASYSRWFHNGCCECVGDSCIDYGLNESQCSYCPPTVQIEDIDDYYYGEDDEDELFYEDTEAHNNWMSNVTLAKGDYQSVWNQRERST